MADFTLLVDHVQGDPYAAPTRVRAQIGADVASLPETAFAAGPRALGTAAFLARAFAEAARGRSRDRGIGKSGEIAMEHPGQETLGQTAVLVDERGRIEARFTVGLPARGRRASGREALDMLVADVPALVRATLVAAAHAPEEMEAHAAANEDAAALRSALDDHGLIAFVADGAHLPRRSGVDDRPLSEGRVVPFTSPPSLRVELRLPNGGRVTGMGLRPGVTLVVGGGFHGKSTLLRALEAGVYNHRPGDGRELVVTRGDAVKIRAEDGRSISSVDISSFISDLPFGRSTRPFSSADASGSTSQAAAIAEAFEAGSRLLLIDEDTSATNFMIRDDSMRLLVPGEPITPFVDRVRDLHEQDGVSCVLVVGGSGDYLGVADTVVRMVDYQPEDVTLEAREIVRHRTPDRASGHLSTASAASNATEASRAASSALAATPERASVRRVAGGTLDPRRGRRASYVRVPDERTLLFGEATIDLAAVEQLAGRAQVRAIGRGLAYLAERMETQPLTIPAALDLVEAAVAEGGLDALEPWKVGDLAEFRRFELAAAMNRLRGLRVRVG